MRSSQGRGQIHVLAGVSGDWKVREGQMFFCGGGGGSEAQLPGIFLIHPAKVCRDQSCTEESEKTRIWTMKGSGLLGADFNFEN